MHSPLPMPPPPSPALPGGLNDVPVATATLSTLRKPGEYQGSAQLVSDGFTFAEGAGLDAAFDDLGYGHKTTCVADEVGGLPCVSADLETTCIDGLQHCGSAAYNTQDPMLEIKLDSPPRERGAFLWGLRITLPQTAELAGLLFQSAEFAAYSGGANGTDRHCHSTTKPVVVGRTPREWAIRSSCATRDLVEASVASYRFRQCQVEEK